MTPLPANAPLSQNGPVNAPLYYASAVLKDGRVFVAGGEYNVNNSTDLLAAEIYDPVADSWSALPTPPAWNNIGDAPACVLPDGKLLIGDINSPRTAIFDPISRHSGNKKVYFCRTFDHSTMAVATGKKIVHTHFHVPHAIPVGPLRVGSNRQRNPIETGKGSRQKFVPVRRIKDCDWASRFDSACGGSHPDARRCHRASFSIRSLRRRALWRSRSRRHGCRPRQ